MKRSLLSFLVIHLFVFPEQIEAGYYEWEDWRWQFHIGREAVFEEALADLISRGVIDKNVLNEITEYGYRLKSANCESGVHGCYECISKNGICIKRLNITPRVFEEGWLDMDPAGAILWDGDYRDCGPHDSYNLYYKYAINLVEAVKFILLHEYAHAVGIEGDDMVDKYVYRTIIELRKVLRGEKGIFLKINSVKIPCNEELFHLKIMGSPPPFYNLPPGTKMRK